jgi:hypothetical protein
MSVMNDITDFDYGRVPVSYENGREWVEEDINTSVDMQDEQREWYNLGLKVPFQEQTNWCWAATAWGIRKFYDPGFSISQCRAAGLILERSDACADPTNPDINLPWSLYKALQRFKNASGPEYSGQPGAALVLRQIKSGKPVCVRILWDSGEAHFVAISAMTRDAKWVRVTDSDLHADPEYGKDGILYEDLIGAYRKFGGVTHAYTTKSHRG